MAAPALQYKVERNSDGTVTVRFEQGERFTLTAAGICADLTSITAVGIKHVDEVASHIINTIAGSRSHVIRFVNGSLLNFAYNTDGQLIELSAQNLACHISRDNELLFYIY